MPSYNPSQYASSGNSFGSGRSSFKQQNDSGKKIFLYIILIVWIGLGAVLLTTGYPPQMFTDISFKTAYNSQANGFGYIMNWFWTLVARIGLGLGSIIVGIWIWIQARNK